MSSYWNKNKINKNIQNITAEYLTNTITFVILNIQFFFLQNNCYILHYNKCVVNLVHTVKNSKKKHFSFIEIFFKNKSK